MNTSNLESILCRARCLLFSFNGPICTLFNDEYPISHATDNMRQVLRDNNIEIPEEIQTEANPLNILRYTKKFSRITLLCQVEEAFRAAELAAIPTAIPTPGACQTITAAHWSGRRVGIVSNVSPEAIHAYLAAYRIDRFVHPIVGRSYGDPIIYKPNPSPVAWAMHQLQMRPHECVLVGTSDTDLDAGNAAKVAVLPYSSDGGMNEYLTRPEAVLL